MIDVTYITPIVIEITLYKYNLRDNQLISALKHSTDLFTLPQDPKIFLVTTADMRKVIDHRFSGDLDKVRHAAPQQQWRGVNSPYFINNLLKHFTGLQFFRVIVSNKQSFNRMKIADEKPMVDFNYRATYAKLDLTKVLDKENLKSVRHLLEEAGILTKSKIKKTPYIQINISDMFAIFGNKESQSQYFSEYFDDTINTVLDIVGPKLEQDNTNMLLIIEP